jgi:hypothetical protein
MCERYSDFTQQRQQNLDLKSFWGIVCKVPTTESEDLCLQIRQGFLERTNQPTLRIQFNNAVINLNKLVQKLLSKDTQTDRHTQQVK